MVVQRLHVQLTVQVHLAVVRYRVAQLGAVVQLRAAHPVVGGVVVGVGGQPVEDRQFVQRQLIRRGERLAIVQRTAEVLDALPHRVLPRRIVVGVQFLVHGQVAQRLFHLGLRARLEVHVQVLRQVPAQRERAVPQKLRAERDGQLRTAQVLHVALLQLVVVACHLRVERHVLRQPVQPERLRQCHPLRLGLRLLERFPRLIHRRVRVVQRPAPSRLVLVDGRLARRVAVLMAI